MHCFGAATALTLVQCVGFWGQLGAMSIGACVGFYAPVRASQCVVMSTVTTISLRRVTARWAAARADGQAGQPWACPSPRELHDELAARWSIRHSLAARAGAWRELMSADTAVLRAGGVALHVGPRLVTAADVSALVEWRRALRGVGSEPPAAWSLGAGCDGRLLLLYSTDATTAEVIEGFGAAWLAANEAADALSAERKVASAGLAAVSVGSLPAWRRDAAELHVSMAAAGWHCAACCIDDTTRRIKWREDEPSAQVLCRSVGV